MKDYILEPQLIEREQFMNKKIKKVVSGSNHCLILADERVYSWGDSETCCLGRMPMKRRKQEQEYRVESIGQHHVQNVWSAGYHSFTQVLGRKGIIKYYSWGLNQYSQLGHGRVSQAQLIPMEIEAFRGMDIIQISGGDHHSVALDKQGRCYTWGRNDDS